MKPTSIRFRTIRIRPNLLQFVINEFPLLAVSTGLLFYSGMEDMPLQGLSLIIGFITTMILVYRLIYMCRTIYRIEDEVFVYEHGIFQRKVDYTELYRIVDFNEHQNLFQQILGIKTISIFSGDRTTPKVDMIGINVKEEIVGIIRERVEYNKRRRSIYEITNR